MTSHILHKWFSPWTSSLFFSFHYIFYFILRVCHKSHTFHLISHTRPLFFHRFSFDFREGHHILDFIYLYHECNFLPRWQHLLFFSFSILIFFLVTFFSFKLDLLLPLTAKQQQQLPIWCESSGISVNLLAKGNQKEQKFDQFSRKRVTSHTFVRSNFTQNYRNNLNFPSTLRVCTGKRMKCMVRAHD